MPVRRCFLALAAVAASAAISTSLRAQSTTAGAAGSQGGNPMAALRGAAQDAMKLLAWMVGEWEGPASIEYAPGQTIHLTQTESIKPGAFNTAMFIQGRGTMKNGGTEQVVFESAGIILYDVSSKKYIMTSTPGSGHAGTFDMKVDGTTVVWGFAKSSTEQVRYEISHTADGKWKEIGYVSTDGGKTWKQNMEMLLSRKP